MASVPLPLEAAPIAFGTDGWRGILGVDITLERLLRVAAAAAAELAHSAPAGLDSRTVIIGFDRRFLAPELGAAIAAAVRGVGARPRVVVDGAGWRTELEFRSLHGMQIGAMAATCHACT